jgi:hypothetical protein
MAVLSPGEALSVREQFWMWWWKYESLKFSARLEVRIYSSFFFLMG